MDYIKNILDALNTLNINEFASFYFYSALLQANAALVTLTAMFIIAKRQFLDNNFNNIEKIIIDYFKSSHGININYGDIFTLESPPKDFYEKIAVGKRKPILEMMETHAWKARFTELKKIKDQRDELWKNAFPAITFMFAVLFISVILLPFSSLIHEILFLELLLFFIVILSEITSLILLFIFLRKAIKE